MASEGRPTKEKTNQSIQKHLKEQHAKQELSWRSPKGIVIPCIVVCESARGRIELTIVRMHTTASLDAPILHNVTHTCVS